MAASQKLPLLLLASILGQLDASAFLRKDASALAVETHFHLLEELEGALGEAHRQATEGRMSRLEETLRPIIAAVPKTADGKLEHMAVRYVLHRLFVEKHGWYVRGLAPDGETWNSSSPIAMLQDKAPQDIFESRLQNQTFGLHELAVLAATLENLVHDETIERLTSAFALHETAIDRANLTEEQMEELVDTYMMIYVLGDIALTKTPKQLRRLVVKAYPSWRETATFIRDVRRDVLDRFDVNSHAISFNDTMRVVEEIGERYGRWQDRECRELKHDLMKLEHQGTGRVLLKDFYGSGQWQFGESVQYLRQLGALDETDPARLKVLIANYVNAPSNCVASSGFYSVCCIDECESLLGRLERSLAAPEATPERIAEVISTLPSATVEAPRDLPASLRENLEKIAQHHGNGLVPLHARLFSQLMHHAFPRECSFPHVTGTTRPLTGDDYAREAGRESLLATVEEKQQHIDSAAQHKEEDGLPWVEEEELFCARPHGMDASTRGSYFTTACRGLAFVALLLSASVMLVRNVASAKTSLSTNPNKFYV